MITPIPALKTRWVDPQIGARMVVVTDGVGVDVVVLEVDLRVDLPMDRRGVSIADEVSAQTLTEDVEVLTVEEAVCGEEEVFQITAPQWDPLADHLEDRLVDPLADLWECAHLLAWVLLAPGVPTAGRADPGGLLVVREVREVLVALVDPEHREEKGTLCRT